MVRVSVSMGCGLAEVARMIAPSVLAAEIERHAGLPTGAGERFTATA